MSRPSSNTVAGRPLADLAGDLAAAKGGDAGAFAELVSPIRTELHAHCYRMLGSVFDADDAVQEGLLRAWRALGAFEGRSSLRTWLFAIVTRVCLDMAASRGRRALPIDLGPASSQVRFDAERARDIRWLTPYPSEGPEDLVGRRESLELALVAALQRLPGNQRAALLLFEVLDFSAAEIAEMMKTTSTSVNSALARARRTLANVEGAGRPMEPNMDAHAARRLAARFARALESGDLETFVSLLTRDVTWTMPPLMSWYSGIDAVAEFAQRVPMTLCPSWRHLPVAVSDAPGVAFYLGTDPSGPHEAWAIAALTLRGDRIAGITSFLDPDLFTRFGLPRRVA